ncbi:PE PGRS family protein [Mycobacterium tuberculosis]|nr:PE PGRS family protein [Mycobacterium tuberculosis]
MSFLIASPEALAATATYLTGIGSAISAANAVAAAPTTPSMHPPWRCWDAR